MAQKPTEEMTSLELLDKALEYHSQVGKCMLMADGAAARHFQILSETTFEDALERERQEQPKK